MTQQELNVLFSITIVIHTDPWFKNKSRDEVQNWVAQQLRDNLDIYSYPIGSSWGSIMY